MCALHLQVNCYWTWNLPSEEESRFKFCTLLSSEPNFTVSVKYPSVVQWTLGSWPLLYQENCWTSSISIKMNTALQLQQPQQPQQQEQNGHTPSMKQLNYFANMQILDGIHDEERNRPFICSVCSASYKTRTHLRRHMFVHLSCRPYPCRDCGKGFNRKEHLNKHTEAVHSGTKYECGFCGKEISRKDHLNRHIKNMHSSVQYSMNGNNSGMNTMNGSLQISFKNEQQGVNSIQNPQGQQANVQHHDNVIKVNLPCALKQKAQLSFLTPSQITRDHHYTKSKSKSSIHFKAKANQDTAGVSNPSQFSLGEMKPEMKSGQLSGSDKKFVFQVYNCTECNSTFTTEKDFSFHSRTHKPQPYKCSECPRAYTRREKLTEHIRCFHQGQKFSCEYCHKALSRKDHVLRHVRSVHPEVLANRFVTMAEDMDTQSRLLNYNPSSSAQTSLPTQAASTSSSAAALHGEMNILLRSVCHICLKVFGTAYHLSRHMESCHNGDIRPYNCTACSKQFKRKDHLTKHMKSHCPSVKKMNEMETNGIDAIDSLQILMSSPEDEVIQENQKNLDLTELFSSGANTTHEKTLSMGNSDIKIDVNHLFNVEAGANNIDGMNDGNANVTTFPCGHCQKEFTDRDRLIQHLQVHSSNEMLEKVKNNPPNNHTMWKPIHVQSNTNNPGDLNNSNVSDVSVATYPCGHCQKEFTDRSRLIQHLQ
ncbi:unnamed protein product [Allacma fusca]|uniref:C2H2-type domain-containing protein n=1 Tax=Allacma fusca TaxID=39272 RepID=A0A8J2PBB5_9HEXA|nr:unnamed protein product [Allacma fusca]